MGISNKLAKHNNQYINIKISVASHNQDPEFLNGNPFNEKGKTRGPSSLVKSSTIENGFTTIFSRANARDYQEKKNCKVEFIQLCLGFIPCQICL